MNGVDPKQQLSLLKEHLNEVADRAYADANYRASQTLGEVYDHGQWRGRHDGVIDLAKFLLRFSHLADSLDWLSQHLRGIAQREYAEKPDQFERSIWAAYRLGEEHGRHNAYIDYAKCLISTFLLHEETPQ